MPTKSWRNINKFRLFTMVALSLLTSLPLSINDDLWKMRDIVTAIIQASICGFAYMQCPTISKPPGKGGEEDV